MVRLASSAAAAFLLMLAPAQAGKIWILTDKPAHCTLSRDGQPLGVADTAYGLSRPVTVDEKASQDDVVATCTQGDATITKTVPYQTIPGTEFRACPAPAACPPSRPADRGGYGPILRMSFDPVPRDIHPEAIVFDVGAIHAVVDLSLGRVWLLKAADDRANMPDFFILGVHAVRPSLAAEIARLAAALDKPSAPDPAECVVNTETNGSLSLLDGAKQRTYYFPVACKNPQVDAVLNAMTRGL